MSADVQPAAGFAHEALFYDDETAFLEGAVPFLRDGISKGEGVLVATGVDNLGLLRDVLGDDAEHVVFEDMASIGRNPGRIISAWALFVEENASHGRQARGLGEPIWPGRSDAEVVECLHHEALLNVAFGDANGFTLLCPYDAGRLGDDILQEARRTHPWVTEHGRTRASTSYDVARAHPLAGTLPDPVGLVETFAIAEVETSAELRQAVAEHAWAAGLDPTRSAEFVLAVHEAVTNTQLYADGRGSVRLWREDDALVCDVVDHGRIHDPLVGRLPADPDTGGGRGLWLINHLCDLVEIRSSEARSIVRMRVTL